MKSQMVGRDFLTLMDFSKEEVEYFLDTAAELKRKQRMGEPHEYLKGKQVALIFEKHSTRTRVSFQAGIAQLGAQGFYMKSDELQLARGEPIKDTARVIDRYCDALVIRTFGQETVEEFARYMENPVINALTDLTHPCQGLADLLTIQEKKGAFKGLKLAFVGDMFNMSHTTMVWGSMMGVDTYIAGPVEKYQPNSDIVKLAKEKAEAAGSKLVLTTNLEEAVTDADIVFAITFFSMGQKDAEQKKKDFAPFQITEEVLAKAKDDVIFMHPLPAHRGEELTEEVIEGPRSVVWDQAENRLHVQKAVLSSIIT
jgi:ornithine carbamoyltransferase